MSEELLQAIRRKCGEMEIPLMGVAGIERWKEPPFQPWMPEEFYPDSIFPGTRSVIVIGLPINLPVLETSPSIWYREMYGTVNSLLDQYTYRLANFLNKQGHPSVFVPRDGYLGIKSLLKNPVAFFSHRHAAFLAGIGNFGMNNMLLTREFGPRVRFGSVFTKAQLPSNPLLTEKLCNGCLCCVKMCPAQALGGKDYPERLTDKNRCLAHSAELNEQGISPCGICIKVCPVGEDRKLFGRENSRIYTGKDLFPEEHRAWEHVRRYGRL